MLLQELDSVAVDLRRELLGAGGTMNLSQMRAVASVSVAWSLGTAVFALFMAYGLVHHARSPSIVQRIAGWSALSNGVVHSMVCAWCATRGVGDLSFEGPFTDPDIQIKNLLVSQ